MRLATFEIISDLIPIEGKDKIELAKVLEYEIVVKKGEFQVGDWCVYIFIDTVVDISRDHFKFLDNGKQKTKNLRIKTSKFGDVYSQGLALPLFYFQFKNNDSSEEKSDSSSPETSTHNSLIPDPNHLTEEELETIDLGDILGVAKYEKSEIAILPSSVDSSEERKTTPHQEFPVHYIHITDEDNLQTKSKVLKELVGVQCDITVKMDGSSMTLIWDDESFYICSRRLILYKIVGEEVEYECNSKSSLSMINFIKDLNRNNEIDMRNIFRGQKMILQGEFCGPKINGNKLMLNRYEWYIFTIATFENIDRRPIRTYMSRDNFLERYSSQMWYGNTIKLVPLFDRMIPTEITTVDIFKHVASMVRYRDPCGTKEVLGEGIVVRPTNPFHSRFLGKNCSFKIVNRDYKD